LKQAESLPEKGREWKEEGSRESKQQEIKGGAKDRTKVCTGNLQLPG